jgi:LmbE family N-acetylglucosaminyl deacetylase
MAGRAPACCDPLVTGEPLRAPERALAIGAHPDDIEFGAGGVLARWARFGCEVTMVVVTDGSKGTWDPGIDPADLVATRKAEQLAAAHALGAARVVHLEHVDGELEYDMALRAEVCMQIRLHRPDVLVSHDPWKRYMLHPDHRATGWAAIDGMVAARDHLFFPRQGLPPHRPVAMLLWSADEPDHVEDIGDAFEAKLAALLCHASQGTTTMDGAGTGEDRLAAFRSRLERRAAEAGGAAGVGLAEAFKRLEP